jgi:UDP-N-acetylglucosamine 2-epimerase (non-hydrolysing)
MVFHDVPVRRHKVAVIAGTRPEAIKMAPVVRELERRGDRFEPVVVSVGQHREMLEQAFKAFGIKPDVDLALMQANQGLSAFASRSLAALADLFTSLRPDFVLVQGDTTSVVTSALAAFYAGIRVGHVEAGLRSFDRYNPFPEEINRRVAGCVADIHFAPTVGARDNLLREGVAPSRVFVTGNTIVDALSSISIDDTFDDAALADLPRNRRLILVTAHRRENHGEGLSSVFRALRTLVQRFHDIEIVYPVHLNPNVQRAAMEALGGMQRVRLVNPVSYADLLRLLSRCYLVLTDSGGIQEEAPSFRKPVLVLRETTERPEAVEAGAAKLVGTLTDRIVDEAAVLLDDEQQYRAMQEVGNPFGDGHASERIVSHLEQELQLSAEESRARRAPDRARGRHEIPLRVS